jgi:xylulokinase
LLGVDHVRLSELALEAPPGADGLVLVPYLEGERTPNLPEATGALHGMRLSNSTQAHLARAAVEGMLCGQADGLEALRATGLEPRRLHLIGGAARSEAVRRVAPDVFGLDVLVPQPGEYVADGAARQAAWVLSGEAEPPLWSSPGDTQTYEAGRPEVTEAIRTRYAEARERYLNR